MCHVARLPLLVPPLPAPPPRPPPLPPLHPPSPTAAHASNLPPYCRGGGLLQLRGSSIRSFPLTQTAFAPGCDIADNVLFHLEEVGWLEETDPGDGRRGCIAFLDFEKAYNRMDRAWMHRCL